AHQPNRRLRLAAEPQTGRREVSALTDARKTLAYDFFRILRAPRVLASNSPANRILLIMGEWLAVQRRNGQLSDILFISLNDRLNDISVVLAGCERIAYTPIPFAYTLILHRTVYLFCIMLPFALVVDLHYMTPFISVLISYTFISLDCLAEELEDPFGTENNDLPLDAICNAIEIDLLQMNDEAEIPAKILPDRHYQLT
ncbi:bestrophin family protein, partial [Escherichia coli]